MAIVNQYRQSDNRCSTIHGFVLVRIAVSIALLFYLSVFETLAQHVIQAHTSGMPVATCIDFQAHEYFDHLAKPNLFCPTMASAQLKDQTEILLPDNNLHTLNMTRCTPGESRVSVLRTRDDKDILTTNTTQNHASTFDVPGITGQWFTLVHQPGL